MERWTTKDATILILTMIVSPILKVKTICSLKSDVKLFIYILFQTLTDNNGSAGSRVSQTAKTLQETTVVWLSTWRGKNQSSAEYDEEDFNCNEENRSVECLQCLNQSQKHLS